MRIGTPVLLTLVFFLSVFFVWLAGDVPCATAGDCGEAERAASDTTGSTFTLALPVVPQYEGVIFPDSITVPNGRPVYALIVHGYTQNGNFDQLMCYNFAKRLMEDGAYVHWAWWNNLCKEYMGGPLHHAGSHPGLLGWGGIWNGAVNPDSKALPVDDYQFQADAELLLEAIRENNPSAMIIVVGHSMGGAAVARLGTNTDVVLDILAPIDPVGNRSRPWVDYGSAYHNWTRYRIAREDLVSLPPPDPERPRTFRGNVINLHHRYQMEYEFPMDHQYREPFVHNAPLGGSTTQRSVATCASASVNCYYPVECCALDGHGEIVGFLGLRDWTSFPLALEAQGDWPRGVTEDDQCRRRRLLMEMPYADYEGDWVHRPVAPELCMVSEGLISLYETMNRPPLADAGGDRTVAQAVSGVALDGSASTDPDGDDLSYIWRGALWETNGRAAAVPLALGTHEITLTVRDPSGHTSRDTFELTVVEDLHEPPPAALALSACPNPFRTNTRVVFELAERQHVSLQIFDLQGHLVKTLEEGTFDPGPLERAWSGRNDAGRAVASGTYFVRMRVGDRAELSKLLFLK